MVMSARELRRVSGLFAILGLPVVDQRASALVVVGDGRLGVVRRLLREELRAEEAGLTTVALNAERRDLRLQRLHPALEAELRGGVRRDEVETGRDAGPR